MSDTNRITTYTDTVAQGSLVIQVAHNLSGTAYPFLYELIGGQKVFVSLYDPRIAEFKNLDDNNVQITFASDFAGYLDLIVYDFIRPSLTTRVMELEDKYNQIGSTLDLYTPRNSWKQMNNYFDSKFKEQEALNNDLQTQIESLRQELNSL